MGRRANSLAGRAQAALFTIFTQNLLLPRFPRASDLPPQFPVQKSAQMFTYFDPRGHRRHFTINPLFLLLFDKTL